MTLDGKSTLVPAGCGATVWMIAGGLGEMFKIPDGYAGFIACALSGLFAALMVAQIAVTRWWERIVYWILNSLIIATIGLGTTSTVTTLQDSSPTKSAASAPTPAPTPPPALPTPTPAPPPPAAPTPAPREKPPVENHVKEAVKEVGRRLKGPF